jgi:pimeloyl-ACP methyl ester carboxylesterase
MEPEFVDWSGGKLACYWRSGRGRPILLLHGICGGAIHFETAFAALSLRNNPLLAIDLPGFGYSTAFPGWDLETVKSAIKEAMDDYLDEEPWGVAHSISSSIAARLLPNLAGVTLLEGNLLPEHLDFSDKVLKFERHEYVNEFQRIQRSASVVMRFQTQLKDHGLINRYASTYGECTAETVWDIAAACNRDVREGELLHQFSEASKPMFTVFGRNSSYQKTVDKIRGALPAMQLHGVAESGHFPMIDNPAATWKAVANALKDN